MKINRFAISLLLMALLLDWQISAAAASVPNQPKQDSKELQLRDMLVSLLLPQMAEKLKEDYEDSLACDPVLYPYDVDVEQVERIGGFRSFRLRITLHADPVIGPHITAGEDRFVFEITPGGAKLVGFEHLQGPDPKHFPPNYLQCLKKTPLIPNKIRETASSAPRKAISGSNHL